MKRQVILSIFHKNTKFSNWVGCCNVFRHRHGQKTTCPFQKPVRGPEKKLREFSIRVWGWKIRGCGPKSRSPPKTTIPFFVTSSVGGGTQSYKNPNSQPPRAGSLSLRNVRAQSAEIPRLLPTGCLMSTPVGHNALSLILSSVDRTKNED